MYGKLFYRLRRQTMLKWLMGTVMVFVVGMYLWHPHMANPSAVELSVNARDYSVEIIRDEWGVPHIFGVRDADTSFGLAYAHAEDDYATIQETIAATRGVLASYRGRSAASTDYIVSLLNVWNTLESRYQQDVPQDVKAIAQAYAAGLNLYAAHYPAQTWQGLAPFTAQDVVAGFMFKTPFFYGLDEVLLELFDAPPQSQVNLAASGSTQAWTATNKTHNELGSNAMAVTAARSGDNTTRLLINSHQPMTGAVAWYEAHLVSEQGLDITGGLFPGTPVILHGFNRHFAWANTVNHIDLADVYLLQRNPDNPMQYRLDQQWVDFEQSDITIMVRLLGPFALPVKRRVLRSRHGPVIESNDKSYALRYAGMGEIRQLEQYYRLNHTQSVDDFLSIMQMNALPSINYVVADSQDNIAFLHNAQYPQRQAGWDWREHLPGNRSELIWQNYQPFALIPKLINPASGLLFNANNTPFSATDGSDNLTPQQFPKSMGLASNQTNRSQRFIELNNGANPLNRDAILAQKFDVQYSPKSEYMQTLQMFFAIDEPDLKQAVAQLKKWNGAADIHNPHAALAILALRQVIGSKIPDDQSLATLTKALRTARDELLTRFGRLNPEWGAVNRLVRGEVNLPLDGGPDLLRAIYSIGLDDDEIAYATHGDTWMALVAWQHHANTEQPELNVDVLHQFGSATLDKGSPHYADQAPLFANHQWRKARIDRADIRANASRIYSPNLLTPTR